MGKGKSWSLEDVNYLKDKWGQVSPGRIAKKLNRTENAILQKAYREGLESFTASSEYLFLKELVLSLGYNPNDKYFKKLIAAGLNVRIIKVKSKKYRMVTISDFWKWLKEHPDQIDLSKSEKNIFGKEPKWVEEKRKIDVINSNRNKAKWTTEQERLLVAKAKSNRYTCSELAKEFNRSEAAIRRKLFDFNVKAGKHHKKNNYTKEEINKIIEMHNNKFSISTIAQELGRSEFGIYDKIRRLNL